jgi:hypothetical protein
VGEARKSECAPAVLKFCRRAKTQENLQALVKIFSDIAHYADIKKKNKMINGIL